MLKTPSPYGNKNKRNISTEITDNSNYLLKVN